MLPQYTVLVHARVISDGAWSLQGPNISAGVEDSGYSKFNTVNAVNPQRIEHALEDSKAPPYHSAALTHSWKSEYREAGLPQA